MENMLHIRILYIYLVLLYIIMKESKLDPRAKKTLFMRITCEIKSYCLWCLEIKKTIFSKDVIFNESAILKKVNVEQLEGTPKKKEIMKKMSGSRLRKREVEDFHERRNAVCSEKSNMGVDQPPRREEDGSFVYLLLYVDDRLIASQSLDEIEKLKTRLKNKFKMKDLDEAKMILGMEIVRDRILRKLCLTQKQYLRRVLKRFRFDKLTKRVSTSLASRFKISAAISSKNDAERAYMEKVPYANAVGICITIEKDIGKLLNGYYGISITQLM
ncbi:retrovirus-related pol polyprotein from transposon TNT 1-94 [Tanacetum coccineum]